MNLNGMQVVVISQPGLQNEQMAHIAMKPRLAKQLIGLGVVHILNGVFCIIFQSVSLEKHLNFLPWFSSEPTLAFCGYGFCCGLSFLVTGIIGIAAGIRKSNCQVVAFNIMSIISAVLVSAMIIWGVISAIIFNHERGLQHEPWQSSNLKDPLTTIFVMASMLAATGILEGIIAIWSAIVCCLIGVCNCCLASTAQTLPMILSAEQQAALLSNPMFMTSQQQTMGVSYPQPQTGSTVEGAYTGLNTRMRCSLPSSDVDASTCITTSIYEELHEYEEVEPASKF